MNRGRAQQMVAGTNGIHHVTPDFSRPSRPPSTMDSMSHDDRIEAAIADLESQERTNFLRTARKWGLERTTLLRRYKGQSTSIREANSNSRQALNSAQEEVLIEHANKLTDRGIPPTPQILKNIAEEIAKTKLSAAWPTRFCKRHKDRLKSDYLRRIDHKRKTADNSRHFQLFFDLVWAFSN